MGGIRSRSGARRTRRSWHCGRALGRSSSHSLTTTSRFGECCAPPTRSKVSVPATGVRCALAGIFPNEQSALKTLYLVTRSLDPKGVPVRRSGPYAGSQRSTPWPSREPSWVWRWPKRGLHPIQDGSHDRFAQSTHAGRGPAHTMCDQTPMEVPQCESSPLPARS